MNYKKPEFLNLKQDPILTEKWVQDLIAGDPSILGLGDLVLRDKERTQPRAGRLDLLLQYIDSKRRYEVEIQLGATDEAHIIRTIEYWDIERKRYPQYEHCAVLIAEDITSRFLNVIALFNGTILFVAIQMRALRVGEHLTLIFTKVMDEFSRGFIDEDEDAEAAPSDRNYWEKKVSKYSLQFADEIFPIVKEIDNSLEMKYNKFYIGTAKNGAANNFFIMRPRRQNVKIEIKLPKQNEYDEKIESPGIEILEYDNRYGQYRLSVDRKDLNKSRDVLKKLISKAYIERIF
ncbi:MAG: hypothetical protein CTY25_11880 [Methylobacterium sp.]|nr:MAG: hypothetical protein CTY25_11880 [Methylobacterium sp.]